MHLANRVDGPFFRIVHHVEERYRPPVHDIETNLPVEPIRQRLGNRRRERLLQFSLRQSQGLSADFQTHFTIHGWILGIDCPRSLWE